MKFVRLTAALAAVRRIAAIAAPVATSTAASAPPPVTAFAALAVAAFGLGAARHRPALFVLAATATEILLR